MRFLPLLIKNALRNRRRFVLTVLSVAVSLFMFPILVLVVYFQLRFVRKE